VRIVSWIVLIVWIGTFIRTVLNLLLIPRLGRDAPPDGPLVSVIIPARNEERDVGGTVRGFLAQTYRNLEIIVVNDRSTDGTQSVLDSLAGIRVIAGSEPPPGWLGKPWALQQGIAASRGEILLLVDADIHYEPWSVAAAVGQLRKSGVAMIALMPRMVMETFSECIVMPMLALTGFSFLPTWFVNRTRGKLFAIGGGTGNMLWRTDHQAVGGHEALKDAVVDDVGLARLLRHNGRRTAVVRADEGVSVRMYHGRREVMGGFTKNVFAVFDRSYSVTFLFVAGSILFHVLPYALAMAGSAIDIATVVVITITRLVLFSSLGYSLPHALFAHPLTGLIWVWIALRSAWVTGVRKRLVWRGRTYQR
jgi:chlorobactene glucosyltransferase